MPIVLIGNIISLLGCTLMVLIGFIKEKRKILYTQCVQFTLQGAANLILGGTSGFIANIVSIARNICFTKWKCTFWLKIGFILIQIILSLNSITSEGALAILPIAAAVLFTWFIDTKSEVKLKIVIISTQILWLIYDFVHINYVAVCFDCFTMISNIAGIFMIRKSGKK